LPFGRKPERNSHRSMDFPVSATLNVRGLSLPDRTRVVARRHLIGCPYLFIAQW
jgi:hypothetical protein